MDDYKNGPVPKSIPDLKVVGEINALYHTQQNDLFKSGLAAKIGVNACAVLGAIKSHAGFTHGGARPGIRRIGKLTGLSVNPVQAAVKVLEEYHLVRVVKRRGKTNNYVVRERLDVRDGTQVICTIFFDYVPIKMHERLDLLKRAVAGGIEAAKVWKEVDIIPGPGMVFDLANRTFRLEIGGVQATSAVSPTELTKKQEIAETARKEVRRLANEMRLNQNNRMPKK